MTYADIKLGYSCNNNCVHCVITGQRRAALQRFGRQDRTTSEYKKELFDSRQRDCDSVTFTGGEPTMRKDLIELLNYASFLGYQINMQTNGRMFYYKEFAEKLAKYNIHYTIALHGDTSEVHDKITRVKGSFKQTVGGIKNLVSLGQNVGGKLVISKLNYKFMPEICRFFVSLGIDHMNFAFPHAQGNAWENFEWVVPTYTEIAPYVHKTIDFVEGHNKENG